MLTHSLAKCKSECADAVWKMAPKTMLKLIEKVRQGVPSDKRGEPAPQVSPRRETDNAFPPSAMVKVKTEKPWAGSSGGSAGNGMNTKELRCFGCREIGHMKRSCPKAAARKVGIKANRCA